MEPPEAPTGQAPSAPPVSEAAAAQAPSAPPVGIADTRSVVIPDHGRILSAELVGTAVLVMCGPGAAILVPGFPGKQILVAFAFGFALLAMVYVISPVSGCHINPAVTLAMLMTNKVTVRHAVHAWIGQIVGGIFGAAIIYGIATGADGFDRGGFASNGWDRSFTADGPIYGLGSVIVVEVVFTALLVFVVLATSTRKFAPGFGGLVAGLTLTLIHLVTIPIDNTSVNPARSLATALFADAEPNALGQLWAFIVFPLLGAVVGVVVWLMIDESRLEDTMLDTDFLRMARDRADDLVD
ncbi:MAG: aquaporin [Actinomycetota bacterium]|nr:aquaporin [Actinomycetota bacterium]